MFKKIMIAVDGSDPSQDAIAAGCKLASEQGAKVHLLHVPMAFSDVAVLNHSATAIPPSMAQIEKAAHKVLNGAIEAAGKHGVSEPAADIEYGQPAKIIVDYAAKKDIDLIVMGRRGLGTFTGLLVGSVTNKVQQLAPCAVLTVK